MEGSDANISTDLQLQIPGLDVHIGSFGSARTYAIEFLQEECFKSLAAFGTSREFARVKDRGVVCEKRSKFVPVKVIERVDEVSECFSYFGFHIALGDDPH